MILHKNVCDFCSNEEDIKESDGKLHIKLSVLSLQEVVLKNKTHPFKMFEGTFCSKNCLVEFVKENMAVDGKIVGFNNE